MSGCARLRIGATSPLRRSSAKLFASTARELSPNSRFRCTALDEGGLRFASGIEHNFGVRCRLERGFFDDDALSS